MKKKKAPFIINIICLLIFVIVLPLVCSFMPYRTPEIKQDTFTVLPVPTSQNQYYVSGEIKNDSIFTLHSIKFKIDFYNNTNRLVGSSTIELEKEFKASKTTAFESVFTFTGSDAVTYAVEEFYYTYTKIGWYLYFCIGLILYMIVYLIFSKQKFYFTLDGKNYEVYVSQRKTAIVVDNQLVAQSVTNPYMKQNILNKEYENHMIKVEVTKTILYPTINISVDNAPVEITKHSQHCGLSITKKDKTKPKTEIVEKKVKETPQSKQESTTFNTKICPYCSTTNSISNDRCTKCGAELKKQDTNNKDN